MHTITFCLQKVCRLVIFIMWIFIISGNYNPVVGQVDYSTVYSRIIDTFNTAVKYWEMSPADYHSAIQKFRRYAEMRAPLFRVNPDFDNTYYRVHSYNLRDDSRRFVRFMFNCYRNKPKICQDNNCLDLAWDMVEDIKSLNSRAAMIQSVYGQLPKDIRNQLTPLFTQLSQAKDAAQVSLLEHRITKLMPDYQYLSQMAVSRAMIRESLGPDEVFLSFFMMDNRRAVYVWRIDAIKDEIIPLKINSAETFLRVEHTKASLEGDRSYQAFIGYLLDDERNQKDTRKSYITYLNVPLTLDSNLAVFSQYILSPLKIRL